MAPRWLPCLLVVWTLLLARARCQHYLLLRPVPSEHLPLVELKEDPDPLLDPREKDLNETELRGALGGHFDARFMSVLPPSSPEDEDPRDRDREAAGSPESDPHALDSGGKKQKPSRNLRRRLQMWLRSYAACPVRRAWTDVGVRFWPRYVKTGRCPDERSCSVPEGMRCAPAKAEHLTLLRWRCVRRKAARKCAWIPVQYPVVSECRCSCAT